MKNRNNRVSLVNALVVLAAGLCASNIQAAGFPGIGETAIGATADYFFTGKSDDEAAARDDFENFGGVSLNARHFITDDLSVSGFTSYGRIKTVNLDGKVNGYSLGAGIRNHFSSLEGYGVRPAIGLGIVTTHYDSNDLDESKTETAFYAEAAGEKSFAENWVAEWGVRGRIELEDAYVDTQVFAGVSYILGRNKSAVQSQPVAVVAPKPVAMPKPVSAAPKPQPEPEQIVSVMVVPERSIGFRVGSSELTANSDTEALREYANAVMTSTEDLTIIVEGHTDSSGPEEYNRSLSERRAETIQNVFISDLDVPADKVEARGFGELRPVSTNSTAAGREQNRRVEIKIRKN